MSGIPVRRQHGPRSHEVAEVIVGGQCVEARPATSNVGVAGAGATRFLGVAIADAVPASAFQAGPVNGVLNTVLKPSRVGLASRGDEVPVRYAARAEFGDLLKCAAAGAVVPLAEADNARLKVGKCIEPSGVNANAVGHMEVH